MSRPFGTSPLHLLRNSQLLRMLFVLTGLCWILGANACALHDLSFDECQYSAGAQHSTGHGHDEPEHVPCCPHPLGTLVPFFEVNPHIELGVESATKPFSTTCDQYRSYSQSPPTPPPIRD